MWPRFGIKVGNSTVCVASAKEDEKIEVIANKHGDRVSQAVLLADGDEIEVGLTAKQKMSSKALLTVSNSFQLIAKNLTDDQIETAIKHTPSRFNKDNFNFELRQQNENTETIVKIISPYEICVEFLKASFELARQCHFCEDHPSVVLSIPLYYPYESSADLAKAAEEAGFHVSQVIPESTAAVLAYDLAENATNKRVLCIKSGGLLTSFTLFELNQGVYTVLNSDGPFYIGGKQFTDGLVDFISKEFYKKHKLDPHESRRSMVKIRNAAENCKHILTTLPSTQIYIDSLMDGVDFNVQMSRARFESLIQPALNEFLNVLTYSVSKINEDNKDIDEIVLAGGTMKIPKIQSVISSRFPDAKMNTSYPPDEVVAIGCGKQTLYIEPNVKQLSLDLHCFSITDDIYVWHDKNLSQQQLIAEKGTLLPSQMIIDLESGAQAEDNGDAVFHVQCNNIVADIKILDAKLVNGIYRLKANIEDHNGQPQVTLACL